MPLASVQSFVHQQLFDKLRPAFICVDTDFCLVEQSENLSDYGFPQMSPGTDVTDHLDFLIGLDSQTKLDLPMVESPNGIALSVSLIPSEDCLTILFTNVADQAEQRQQLQQIANENELLLRQQRMLTEQLERASQELANKNLALEEAARLQNSFLSGVSHEFRTPLTSIIGYSQLLKDGYAEKQASPDAPDPEDSEQVQLQAIVRSSKHLLSLVENLLDQGKLDSDEIVIRPKDCSLAEVIDDVQQLLAPLANAKNIKLQVETNITADTVVVADDSRLRQCLINLLGNAVKFTDMGEVGLQATFNEDKLSVTITDTGLGISAGDLEKIRMPFYQGADTGKAGTGLGLTITEKLIELMGGELSIESTLGEGTRVSFDIPMARFVDVGAEQEVLSSVASIKVLYAEDDLDIAALVTTLLLEKGVDVVHVCNGAEALVEIEKHQYDVLLLDIHMPVLDGYQTLHELQKQKCQIPVLVMSASDVESEKHKAEELGCAAYISKPIDVDDLLLLMQHLLTNESAARQNPL